MTYKTKAGDTFDLISYEQLGSERFTPLLIEANPTHVATFTFDAGILLSLPDVPSPAVKLIKPPWRTT